MRYRLVNEVPDRKISDDEYLLLPIPEINHPEEPCLYKVTDIGMSVWEEVKKTGSNGISPSECVSVISDQYDTEDRDREIIEGDIVNYLEDLVKVGLLEKF